MKNGLAKSSILYSIERTLSRKFFERLRGAVYCIAVGPTLHFFQLSVMGIIHCLPGKNMRAKLLRICHLLPTYLLSKEGLFTRLGFKKNIYWLLSRADFLILVHTSIGSVCKDS